MYGSTFPGLRLRRVGNKRTRQDSMSQSPVLPNDPFPTEKKSRVDYTTVDILGMISFNFVGTNRETNEPLTCGLCFTGKETLEEFFVRSQEIFQDMGLETGVSVLQCKVGSSVPLMVRRSDDFTFKQLMKRVWKVYDGSELVVEVRCL